ncbi:MAG: DUF4330 family protein [Clostridia bacterium]|nr:DUF4330 family protein [Clostridia bacterium]
MEKKKFRFNIIDAIILLVILAAIALLVYVFVISDKTVEEYDKYQIECVMEVTRINENLAGELEIGEGSNVYNPANNKLIGKVVAEPEFKNTITTAFDESTGQEIYPEVEGLKDIFITVRLEAEKTEWGYSAGDLYFVVNSSARFRVGDFECNATCLDLKVVE